MLIKPIINLYVFFIYSIGVKSLCNGEMLTDRLTNGHVQAQRNKMFLKTV